MARSTHVPDELVPICVRADRCAVTAPRSSAGSTNLPADKAENFTPDRFVRVPSFQTADLCKDRCKLIAISRFLITLAAQ